MLVVTEEFVKIAGLLAGLKGHASMRTLVLPYPLEGRPEEQCRAVARQHYPSLLRLLGVEQ